MYTARDKSAVNAVDARYLLTGFLACGCCGGSLFANRRGPARVVYVCARHHHRGAAGCPNAGRMPMRETETAVLGAIERDLLNVAVLETALYQAMEMLRPADDATAGRAHALRDELARLDAEVARLAGAIAAGGDMPALVAALQDRERRRVQIRAQLVNVDRRAVWRVNFDADAVLAQLRGLLTDWQGLLRQETGPARQALRTLLAGRLIFTPTATGAYAFEGPGSVSPLLSGVVPFESTNSVHRGTSRWSPRCRSIAAMNAGQRLASSNFR